MSFWDLVTFWRHFGIWAVFDYMFDSFWRHFGKQHDHFKARVPKKSACCCSMIK